MDNLSTSSGNFNVARNSVIRTEGESVQSISLLLQGKADAFLSFDESGNGTDPSEQNNKFPFFTTNQSIFIGVHDLFISKKHSFSYIALDDCNLYAFPVHTQEQLKDLLENQKDYGAYLVSSTANLVNQAFTSLVRLERFAASLYRLTRNLMLLFWHIKEEMGFNHTPKSSFFREGLDFLEKARECNLMLPSFFDASFLEADYTDIYGDGSFAPVQINTSKVDYFKRLLHLPTEVRKAFFGADFVITSYHCRDGAKCLSEIQEYSKDIFKTVVDLFLQLYSSDKDCIFTEYAHAAMGVQKNSPASAPLFQTVDYIFQKIIHLQSVFINDYCYSLPIDLNSLEILYERAKEGHSDTATESLPSDLHVGMDKDSGNIPEELKDSAKKILDYSGIDEGTGRQFLNNLQAFRNLNDKFSTSQNARDIRMSILPDYFKIYEAVFKKWMQDSSSQKLYTMFLNFSFMDEMLLSPNQITDLYALSDKKAVVNQYSIYGMKDWLLDIYNMEKDPSINEFEMDYFDVFRDMKKKGEVDDRDKYAYDNDREGRLNFEINNLLRLTQRMCHGQTSVYFPIIHEEMLIGNLTKTFTAPDKISEALEQLLQIDFSAFHREISYRNSEKGIEKEFVMKAILPDIILVPIFGSRAIMWQEIAGRNRSTPGRFILPAFTGENLESLILKLIGNFRWELCRTMMGTSWNNLSQKSLTSEYADYIQFYKKMKELSEEAREKVKAQTLKHRNMLRDIFTADYETWINHESKGVIRLNKVARGILFRYCAFSFPIRKSLEKQPIFNELAMQFSNLRSKEAREIENRYGKLIRSGISLDPELEENLKFYRDM